MTTLSLQSLRLVIQGLVDIMQHTAESAISWMEENDMIANPDKFKAIIITKDRQQAENYELVRVKVSLHLQKLIYWA